MNRTFTTWFECTAGHITVGDKAKKVCDAQLWELNYEKGKRKKWTIEKKTSEKKCGNEIIESGEIPRELDYSQVWDHKIAHAFSIGQALDAHFIVGLQRELSKIWQAIR